MKQSKLLVAIVATATLAAAAPVLAKSQGGMFGPRHDFQDIDTDGNGEISKVEMEAHKAARFSKADTNGDGKLSADEIKAQAAQMADRKAARMIERFDTDGDGALSESELPQKGNRGDMFQKLDADGSGGISKQEFEEMRMSGKGMGFMGKHRGQNSNCNKGQN